MKNTRNFHLTATQTWEIFKCCLHAKKMIWCDLYDMIPMVRPTAMGVGAQDDLGEHQSFARKMT